MFLNLLIGKETKIKAERRSFIVVAADDLTIIRGENNFITNLV